MSPTLRAKTKPMLSAVAKELNEPLVIECDVTQPPQVEAMMQQIQDQRGGLDILCEQFRGYPRSHY